MQSPRGQRRGHRLGRFQGDRRRRRRHRAATRGVCRESKVRLVGPNCLGVINPLFNVRPECQFSARMPKAGNVSFISQSGALCTAVLDFAADRDFGFSKFISIGNKADVDEVDLLQLLPQRSRYRSDHDLCGGVAARPGVHQGRQGDHRRRPAQTDSGDQVRPHQRGRPGGRLAYRLAGRLRSGLRCHFRPVGHHPGAEHRRAVRFCHRLCLQERKCLGKMRRKVPAATAWPS
jgi:hypothetical protein